MSKTNATENKLINSTNSFVGACNKIVEYVNSILRLPPQGEGTKEQVIKEIQDLFRQLDGQYKKLENTLISILKDGK